MGYIKPIKSKGRRGKKHLTIYNTDHYKNYSSITEAEMDNVVALTGKNLSAYYEELLKHAKLGISQDKRNFLYVVSGEAYANDDMLAKFIDLGVHIQVLTMAFFTCLYQSVGYKLYTLSLLSLSISSKKKVIVFMLSLPSCSSLLYSIVLTT